MDSPYILPRETIAEKFSSIYSAGKISQTDIHRLQLTLSHIDLTPEEVSLIDRLFHAIKRGWLEVVHSDSETSNGFF
ncbi:hypothetical protein H6G20_12485 [Desertifilum sp. FACHB-1129]|uniref:Uncharacterized protein n=2 Tax=Desertifilum tharense IPPAS B-1220 TaxID=1781255 RepID=A0A1E5QLY3_9CYAN|nr:MULTISPECIES: hypothetical protein [Desertifilum]MCD8487816.1 hypothetical protein [Desertifilum sp.]MDA0212953.1 hypothetical protein [Cyanobacteria bacterium FC1]MDK3155408.1 hypothetical protein [Kamptonema cortianum]NES96522.1 hypothetical protein [Desertifilum sp. SIO1I2]MBD2312479.1 hypothetical protein [Desertifilum sp. FACHB-1129]